MEIVAIELLGDARKEAKLMVRELRKHLVALNPRSVTIEVGDRVELAFLPDASILLSGEAPSSPTAQFLVTEVRGDRLLLNDELGTPFEWNAARVRHVFSASNEHHTKESLLWESKLDDCAGREQSRKPKIKPEPTIAAIAATSSDNTEWDAPSQLLPSKPNRRAKSKSPASLHCDSEQISLNLF